MKHLKLFITVFLITITFSSYAIDPPFGDNNVTSEYGPRLLLGVFDFHDGIDYNPGAGNSDLDDPIPAIEAGICQNISPQGDAGWVFSFNNTSGTRRWSYLHTFEHGSMPTLGTNVTLGNFELGVFENGEYFIIRNAYGTYPRKAFSATPQQIPGIPGFFSDNVIIDRVGVSKQ